MKNKINILLLVTMLVLQACKKDEAEKTSSNNTGGTSAADFTCKIDGTAFVADSARVNTYNGGFSIMAFKNGATAFEFNLKEPAVANHTFTTGGNEAATYVTGSDFFAAQSGELTVTAFDAASHTAAGTFHFTGTNRNDTKTFTEGSFDIK